MPELPEVETVARQLDPALRDRRLRALELRDPKLVVPGADAVIGWRITEVFRLGKEVTLALRAPRRRRPSRWLKVQLRMTGKLIWRPGRPRRRNLPYPDHHLRAIFHLRGGGVHFVDARRFGVIRLWDDWHAMQPDGLDPLDDAFTPAALTALLDSSRTPIKPWLLRQDRLSGIGNIYASEILHRARIDPTRPARSLAPIEVAALRRQTVGVLRAAIEAHGTTFSDYADARGERGGFQHKLRVYGREDEPCRRCRRPIHRLVQQQRSTFYCPSCQT